MSAIDLNLLRVLDALLEEQSVTRAGSRLGLTQSAVSHALGRLRHVFGDPLFVRGPSGMQPTPRAKEIGAGVQGALAQLQTALAAPTFDPASAQRQFTIAAGAYGCAILMPPLAARVAEQAPGVELMVQQPGPDLVEQLDARRADFVFWADDGAPERVTVDPILDETLVWIVRADHPTLPKRTVGLEDLAALSHVVIAARRPMNDPRGATTETVWEGLRPFQQALSAQGMTQRVGITVPDIYSAMAIVLRSDMAALIPRRLAQMGQMTGHLRVIEPPHAAPGVRLSLMMLRERRNEPALAWMREQLMEVGRGI